MAKKIKIEIDLFDDMGGDYEKKEKNGRQVKLDRGDYCITETTGVRGIVENTLIFRTGKIDRVRVT